MTFICCLEVVDNFSGRSGFVAEDFDSTHPIENSTEDINMVIQAYNRYQDELTAIDVFMCMDAYSGETLWKDVSDDI